MSLQTPPQDDELRLLTDEEVADLCSVKPSTVRRWRREGIGPKPTWLNTTTARYRRQDVAQWYASRVA